MAAKTLVVYANGRHVGALTDENGIWSFGYDDTWTSASDAFPLSPAFPLTNEPVVDGSRERPVQWFFDNLLPEEGMRVALAREAKLDATDAWGLLAWYGRESAGALTLLPEGAREAAGLSGILWARRVRKDLHAPEREPLTEQNSKLIHG